MTRTLSQIDLAPGLGWFRGEVDRGRPLRPTPAKGSALKTRISSLGSFWGLMKAYWLSDRWKEAWLLTVLVVALTAAASKSGVWVAEASGALIAAIAGFHDRPNVSPVAEIGEAALMLVAFAALKTVCFIGVRHFFLTTLHRRWRAWLDSVFNEALFGQSRAYFHLLSAGGAENGRVPDNIDQRVQEAIKVMTGGALGLAVGLIGVVASVYFVGEKILETSTGVQGLEFLGEYGTLVLVFTVVALYVPAGTLCALWLGKRIERLNVEMQRNEGGYRAEFAMLTRRSLQVAAALGERVQRRVHARHYDLIDDIWRRQNRVGAAFLSFNQLYTFVTQKVVSYLPMLPAYTQGTISFRNYVTGSELVTELINDCSWLIQVMPDIANLRASARRITELAVAIDSVEDAKAFHRQTGICDLQLEERDAPGLEVSDLKLYHQGFGHAPFVRIDHLHLEPGQWVFVSGPSGCGKSSLVKAMNGLWPHASGTVVTERGTRPFYACQDFRLPHTSLRQLVTMPEDEADFPDVVVAMVMGIVGLHEFVPTMNEACFRGRRWDEILSGGQKQKLILARMLLHKPRLIFLDEATSALDKGSRDRFHAILREHCPEAVVVSVMHEPTPPLDHEGVPFYGSILSIEEGVAVLRPAYRRPSELSRRRRTVVRLISESAMPPAVTDAAE